MERSVVAATTAQRPLGLWLLISLVALLGGVLVLLGATALGWLGLTVVDLVNNPKALGIVELLAELLQDSSATLSGHAGELPFELQLSPPLKLFLFGVLGVWMLWVVSSILKVILEGGLELLRFVMRHADSE